MKKCILSAFMALCMMLTLVPGALASSIDLLSDVNSSSWYYNDVKYVTDNGLMNGVGDNKFPPENTITRGMIVTSLYRQEGEPAVGSNSFTDVKSGMWYTNGVT